MLKKKNIAIFFGFLFFLIMSKPIFGDIQTISNENIKVEAGELDFVLSSNDTIITEENRASINLKIITNQEESIRIIGTPIVRWDLNAINRLNKSGESDVVFSLEGEYLNIQLPNNKSSEKSNYEFELEGILLENYQTEIVAERSNGDTTKVNLDVETASSVEQKLDKPRLKKYEKDSSKLKLVNGSFEEPIIQKDTSFILSKDVPGWETTAKDSTIEFSLGGSMGLKPLPINGKQYAELNANFESELYQVVNTEPGYKMRWSLYHSGRMGKDTMNVNIGDSKGTKERVAEITTPRGWKLYTGTYVIPPGQTSTFFGFESVSAAGGNKTVGNLLDNIQFSKQSELKAVLSAPKIGLIGELIEYTIDLSNIGGTTASNIFFKNQMPQGTTYEPGSIMVNSKSETDIQGEGLAYYNQEENSIVLESKNDEVIPSESNLEVKFKVRVTDRLTAGDTMKNSLQIYYNDEHFEKEQSNSTKSNEVTTKVELNTGMVTIFYKDEKDTIIAEDKIIKANVGTAFEEKPIKISGYEYIRADGSTSGVIERNPQTLIFIYKKNRFELLQEVNKVDSSVANDVNLGEGLSYKLSIKSKLKDVMPKVFYKTLLIHQTVDSSLEEIKNVELTKSDGSVFGLATYDPYTNTIIAKLTEKDQVNQSEDLILRYNAKVKSNIEFDTIIKAKAYVSVTYTNEMVANEKISNEVESKVIPGNLIFESAPSSLEFGASIKISSKEEFYPIEANTGDLSVKDLRGKGKHWSMTAKMTKLLTQVNGNKLPEAMYYLYKGNEQLIGIDESALVYDRTTDSPGIINISESWENKINHPILKVKGGEARKGAYDGVIQWTLQDVPNR